MEIVRPDARGRFPLARFTSELADHYLVKVAKSGVITLVPASVRPAIVDELEAVNPSFVEDLQAAVAGPTTQSELWESVRPSS